MDNHEPEEVVMPAAEASPAEKWQAFAARFRQGMKVAPGWTESPTGFSRTVPVLEGRFLLVRVGIETMSGSTKWYDYDLMYLLNELGIADYFEAFKLTYEVASYTKLAALLKPKDEPGVPMEVSLRLSILLPVREKKPRRMVDKPEPIVTLRLRPHESAGTMYTRAYLRRKPEEFKGQLDIRISQFVSDYD